MLEVGKLAEVTAVHSTAGIMRCVIEEIGARIDSRATILDRSCKQKTSCVTIHNGKRRMGRTNIASSPDIDGRGARLIGSSP